MSDDYDWTPHLKDGEEVLWQGRPDQRAVIWSLADAFTALGVGFALLFFGWFWQAFPSVHLGPYSINPLAVFLLALTAAILLQRFYRDAVVRRRAHYAITSRRALVVNSTRNYLDAQMHLSPELTIFAAGRWYKVVVFTKTSRKIWHWRSGMPFDGPPLRRHPMAGPEAIFLGLPNAVDVASIAETTAKAAP